MSGIVIYSNAGAGDRSRREAAGEEARRGGGGERSRLCRGRGAARRGGSGGRRSRAPKPPRRMYTQSEAATARTAAERSTEGGAWRRSAGSERPEVRTCDPPAAAASRGLRSTRTAEAGKRAGHTEARRGAESDRREAGTRRP